jgi:hypothetical protein
MKQIFFASILFLSFSLFCTAQNFNGGLRLGLCGSQVNGDALTGFNKAGLLGGVFVNRQFGEKIKLQLELLYIQKGSRKPLDDLNTFYRMRVTYIEVPFVMRYKILNKLELVAGPSFGTLIHSQEDNEWGIIYGLPFKKYELSVAGGVIAKLSDRWSADARYSRSVTTIRPFPGTYTTFFDRGQYNIVVEFSLDYEF